MSKENFVPEFLNIPYFLILDGSITYLDVKVYGIILWYCRTSRDKKCTLSNDRISDYLTCVKDNENVLISKGVIQNTLIKLEKLGYIERKYKDNIGKRYIRTEICIVDNPTSSINGVQHHLQMRSSNFNTTNKWCMTPSTNGVKPNSTPSIDVESNNIINNIYNAPHHTHAEEEDLLLKKILGRYKTKISKIATSGEISLTPNIRKILTATLQEFKPLDLFIAIEGFANDPWQMQTNGHREPAWFFQKADRLSQYIGFYNKNRSPEFIAWATKFLNN
jgi:spore coat protein CotF